MTEAISKVLKNNGIAMYPLGVRNDKKGFRGDSLSQFRPLPARPGTGRDNLLFSSLLPTWPGMEEDNPLSLSPPLMEGDKGEGGFFRSKSFNKV